MSESDKHWQEDKPATDEQALELLRFGAVAGEMRSDQRVDQQRTERRMLACADYFEKRLSAVPSLAPQEPSSAELYQWEAEKDEAYRQRNVLVATLAHLYPSGIRRTNIEGWSEDWHGCVYIDLPTGQISYHYHDSQAYLFSDLPPYTNEWDGHDKEKVEYRLLSLPSPLAPQGLPKKIVTGMMAGARLNALEEAAVIATNYGGGKDFWSGGKDIADAIRALKNAAPQVAGSASPGYKALEPPAVAAPEAMEEMPTCPKCGAEDAMGRVRGDVHGIETYWLQCHVCDHRTDPE